MMVAPANSRRRPTMEDQNLVFETSKGVEPIAEFDQMGLKDEILLGIYQYAFEKPTAIQQRALFPIISGHDVIAQAQSGTGKTSMVALASCQIVHTSRREYVFNLIMWIFVNPNFTI